MIIAVLDKGDKFKFRTPADIKAYGKGDHTVCDPPHPQSRISNVMVENDDTMFCVKGETLVVLTQKKERAKS